MRVLARMTAILAVALTLAAAASARPFALPDHGILELAVPDAWQSEVRQPPDRLPPTLRFTAKAGQPFEILVTTLWPIGGKAPPSDAGTVRAEVEAQVREISAEAVEHDIPVKELKGRSGTGYYFSATDHAPKSGEYKYLTQGILPVGGLVLTFTILTNDGESEVVENALAALRLVTVRQNESAK